VKDPMKMLKQVQQMQDRMNKVQLELDTETVEASVGGGAVRVVATGTQKVVSVTIDPEAASDIDMLQDLVRAAVNEAARKVDEEMQSQLGGMLPPGMKMPGV